MISRIDVGTVPDLPGSYQFKDQDGRVIYVGKAKSLRARLSNYFQPPETLHPRVAAMTLAATSLEWISVNSDLEAMILEFTLIKKYRPRFNVRLRDDKSYPYLMVTADQQWPRVAITRSTHGKGKHYFGPYPQAYALRETMDLLIKAFPVRTCSDSKFQRCEKLGKPCLLYHIQRCAGPCIGGVDKATYTNLVSNFEAVLKGKSRDFVETLKVEMSQASDALEFEAATRIRDRLTALVQVIERQEMVGAFGENLDVIGLHLDDLECQVEVLIVRDGRVSGRRSSRVDRVEDISDRALLARVIEELYIDVPTDFPKEIIVPFAPEEYQVLSEWMQRERGSRITIKVPQRGHKRALLERANRNAEESFKRNRIKRASDHNARAKALSALANDIGLNVFPLRIECFDMSHLGGTNYVGSMVVMEDGLFKKSEYRRFKVSLTQNDDFGAMYEVVTRRLARLNDEDEEAIGETKRSIRFSYPPSLLVIDGGKGQLSMARKALLEAQLGDEIAVISLAKKFEEVYIPDQSEPIRIPRTSESLFLLQQLRDEAHRFAISFHRELRGKAMTKSILDDVIGLGPIRKKRLLAQFGSLKRLRELSLQEMLEVSYIPNDVSRRLYSTLHEVR